MVILDDGVRKRHYHLAEKGKIKSFVVQLEVMVKDQWKPVIRYDCAHGSVHVDRYHPSGKKKKIPLDLELNSALTLADWDINNNWEKYIQAFRRNYDESI